MTAEPIDVFKLIGYVQADLEAANRKAQAQLVTLRSYLAGMNLPPAKPKPACPKCGIPIDSRLTTLEAHLANVHGQEPE